MTTSATTAVAVLEPLRARPSLLVRLGRTARAKPLGTVSFLLILLTIVVAVAAPLIAPFDPEESLRGFHLRGPSPQFWMGTDQYGRDLFSRIVFGARISLIVGLSAVALGTAVGATIGIISGFFEGRTDMWIQRLMDAFMAIPTLVLALTIVAALGPGLNNIVVAIGLSQVPRINRIVRGSVLSEKQNVYVEAARSIGCGNGRIMARHILPNVTAPIIVIATITIAAAILEEATLSFLGVGVPENIPSWGGMLSGTARKFMLVQPWMAIWPGLAITVAVLAWNLFGDALRDVWDPRLRGSR